MALKAVRQHLNTCPGQLRCLGQNFFSNLGLFLNKPLVPGSFAAWGRTFSQKLFFFNKPLVPGSFAAWGRTFSPSSDVVLNKPLVPGSFAACGRTVSRKRTFRNSGTPLRRTKRRKSPKMDFQEFWDSCAQNKTSEIPKNGLSGILELLCAELDVGNLKKCTSRISGTPVRRTRRQQSQKMHCQDFWNSCAQNKTSDISKIALSGFPGLLCAEQDVRNLNNCTFWNYGTPVRRTKRRKY